MSIWLERYKTTTTKVNSKTMKSTCSKELYGGEV